METWFSLYKVYRNAQGQLTPQCKIRSGWISNLSEFFCLPLFPASLKKIQSKMAEKSQRHYILWRSRTSNSVMVSPIWQIFELILDFLPAIVSCKYEKYPVKKKQQKMWIRFSPNKIYWNAQGQLTPAWKIGSGWILNLSKFLCLSSFPASL